MKLIKNAIFITTISILSSAIAQETNCRPDGLGGFSCTTRPRLDQQIGGSNFIDPSAFQRGAELGEAHRQNEMLRQQMLQQQQYQMQMQQQQQYQQQVEQMMRNATRQNVDAANIIRSGMSVEEVVRIFGSYPFHSAPFKVYDTMQWCRTNPPGRPDDYAVVYFYEGKVAKVLQKSQTADMDCRSRPALVN